jgi:hypothetical protein
MRGHATESQLAQGMKGQPRGVELLRVEARAGALMGLRSLRGATKKASWATNIDEIGGEDAVYLLEQMHLLGLRTGLTVPMSPDQLRADPLIARTELLNRFSELTDEVNSIGEVKSTEAERLASASGVSELIDFFSLAPRDPSDWSRHAWANGVFLALRSRASDGVAP